MNTHYALLGVPQSAPPDEVKRAFRREVARYHPDKVQHLGREFQEMAADRSAALTEAYRVLMDVELRRQYDERLASLSAADPGAQPIPRRDAVVATSAAAASAERIEYARAPEHHAGRDDAARQTRNGEGDTVVRRAVLSRFKDALSALGASAIPAAGFDLAYEVKGRRSLFRTADPDVRVAVKLEDRVDAASVESSWGAALRLGSKQEAVCLMVLGSELAPARELAAVIAGLRRKSRGTGPCVVPVDIRDWQALVPPETPAAVRALLARLQNNG